MFNISYPVIVFCTIQRAGTGVVDITKLVQASGIYIMQTTIACVWGRWGEKLKFKIHGIKCK